MLMHKIMISNARGLHAQTCARIVRIAGRCRCNISLVVKGRRASARNIVAVMMLTATMGATIRIEADGPDEAVAMRQIAALFQDGVGERR
jgi:phosphocarrier protein